MEEKDMTLERLYEMYDNDGYYVDMERFKETGVVTLKFEEKNEKENEEC